MLRRYVYRPANVLTTCGHGPTGQKHGRAGDVVELDDERRDTYLRLIPCANGGLCLIPEDEPAAPVSPALAPGLAAGKTAVLADLAAAMVEQGATVAVVSEAHEQAPKKGRRKTKTTAEG